MENQYDNLLKWLSDRKFQSKAVTYASPVVVFWGVTFSTQRACGLVKYYSGKWQGSGIIGILAVGASSYLTQKICFEFIYPNLPEIPKLWRGKVSEKTYIERACLTTGIYALLDLNMCQTIFPSSILLTGSYARGRHFKGWANMSVPTNSAKASAKEKVAVTRLGRVFGCHHCGNRQLFGWKGFIADHMPPTKMANEMNEVFWRRWLGLKVNQSLWPQCWDCFQLQGSAVRTGDHKLVYHYRFKLHHMSVLFAVYLQQQPFMRKALEDVESDFNNVYQFVQSGLQKLVKLVKK
jgi:hypothetical protein